MRARTASRISNARGNIPRIKQKNKDRTKNQDELLHTNVRCWPHMLWNMSGSFIISEGHASFYEYLFHFPATRRQTEGVSELWGEVFVFVYKRAPKAPPFMQVELSSPSCLLQVELRVGNSRRIIHYLSEILERQQTIGKRMSPVPSVPTPPHLSPFFVISSNLFFNLSPFHWFFRSCLPYF